MTDGDPVLMILFQFLHFSLFAVFFSGKWRTLRLHRVAKHADQVRNSVRWISISFIFNPNYIIVNFSQPVKKYIFLLCPKKKKFDLIQILSTTATLLVCLIYFFSSQLLTMKRLPSPTNVSMFAGPTCRISKTSPTTFTMRTTAARSSLPSPATEWTPPRPKASSQSTVH